MRKRKIKIPPQNKIKKKNCDSKGIVRKIEEMRKMGENRQLPVGFGSGGFGSGGRKTTGSKTKEM